MGNYSFSLNMFSNQNKDNSKGSFQSVLPQSNNQHSVDMNKKRKLSFQKTNKTAPSPSVTIDNNLQLHTDSLKQFETGKALDVEPNINFDQTESQLRRERMADCEFECSEITNYLYVGGYYIARNRELLKEKGITYIVNCASAVVENHFIDDKTLKYISLSMVDGRQDDISWFLCEVIKFITRARSTNTKVLIHCEKGISRSCSFAIAYYMWNTGYKWKACFDYVKSKRKVCAPNTAFTCNLIELDELLLKDNSSLGNLLFRCAYHLNHDPYTPCLKLCRNQETRKIIQPRLSMLDSKGVYVIRIVKQQLDNSNTNNYYIEKERIYIWSGKETTEVATNHALELTKLMYGVFTSTEDVKLIKEGKESQDFLNDLKSNPLLSDEVDHSMSVLSYDDYFDYPPSLDVILSSSKQMEADHTSSSLQHNRPNQQQKQTSIKGFEIFTEPPSLLSEVHNVIDDNPTIHLENLEQQDCNDDHITTTEPNTSRPSSTVSIATNKLSKVRSIRINSNASSVFSNLDNNHSLSLSRENSTSSKIKDEDEINHHHHHIKTKNTSIPPLISIRRPSYPENNLENNIDEDEDNISTPINKTNMNIKLPLTYCDSPVFEQLDSSSTRGGKTTISLEMIEKRNESDYISPENSLQYSSNIYPLKKRFSKDKDILQLNNMTEINNINMNQEQIGKKLINPLDFEFTKHINSNEITVNTENNTNIIIEQVMNQNSSNSMLLNRSDSKNSMRPSSSNSSVFPTRNNKVAPLNINNISSIQQHQQIDTNNSNPNTARSSISNQNTGRNRTGTGTSETITDITTSSPRVTSSSTTTAVPTNTSNAKVSKLSTSTGVLSALLRIPSRTLSPVITTIPTSSPSSAVTVAANGTNINNTKNLNLPITERTGTPVEKEKHPENISLSRAPTPIEDLTPVKLVGGRVTPIAAITTLENMNQMNESNTLTPSDIVYLRNNSSQYIAQNNILIKPLLYQAISSKQSRLLLSSVTSNSTSNTTSVSSSLNKYEWQAMGVYDDEDLDEESLFLLLCPNMEHFIWVGKSFSLLKNSNNNDNNKDKAILNWVSSIHKGEVKFDDYIGNNLITNSKVSIIISGTETEAFWQSFNEGY